MLGHSEIVHQDVNDVGAGRRRYTGGFGIKGPENGEIQIESPVTGVCPLVAGAGIFLQKMTSEVRSAFVNTDNADRLKITDPGKNRIPSFAV